MFSVDFETLHQLLQQLLYTGVFRAQINASRNFPEEGYIELQVKEGVIDGCYFVSNQGKTYKLEQWGAQLAWFGVLDWNLVPMQSSRLSLPSPASPTSPAPDSVQKPPRERPQPREQRSQPKERSQPREQRPQSRERPLPREQRPLPREQRPPPKDIPSHMTNLSLVQLRQWPPLYRQVYSLIDGRRQLSEIAQMLHKSHEEIEKVIQDLLQRGLIQLR